MNLRDLDERLVPALARWLDRVLSKLPSPPEPTGPAPLIVRLRRVDDRWTRRGPLALLRDVPQLGAVALAALVLGGAVTVASRTHPPPAAQGTQAPGATIDPGAEADHLGPQIGDKVPAYLRTSRAKLLQIGAGQPDGVVVAVVSFASYRTPAQARDLLGPIPVKRVFYRAAPLPLNQTTARSVAVADIVRDSRKEFARIAGVQSREAAELRKVAATIQNDPVQKADQERDALLYSREAAVLTGPCACVFAVVVRTKLRLLLDLLAQPAVRAIDPSRPGAKIEDFDYSGLLPEEKVTVTGGNQAG
ncbi:MAG: hypothetical protein QOE45_2368 [Frankiaceae bacterium]|jgi:hypothetical protein|nr:hypothetical protein [Frankiaceae bacterium]